MLLTLPNLLNADEVTQAQALLRDAPWEAGRSSAGLQAQQVKNNEQLDHACSQAQALRQMVLQALDRSATFFSATLPRRVFPPRFNRYGGATNHYGNHVDNAIRFDPTTGHRLRTDVSATLFLSAPDTYDGGELCIEDTYGTQSIKLPAGHLVIYPGTSVHQVRPVTRGSRVACFFWIESMVRDDAQRRLLYELDTSITQLRTCSGDDAITTALTGNYHNLLRMWAQP